MKKLYFISAFTFLVSFFNLVTIHAQWVAQTSPLGTEILGKMQFVSATEGWIVCGSNGSLLHTINAGTTWEVVTPFPTDTAMGNPSDTGLTMSWPNSTHGWALKTYGYNNESNDANGATLYQTVNGGADWTKKDFPALVPSVIYSSADLVGTWQIHALFIDNTNDANIFNGWAYGSTTINSDGTSSYTTTNNQGQITNLNSTNQFTISSRGKLLVSGTDMDGFMSANKNLIIFTQTDGSGGYNLVVWQKVNPSTVYSTADLEGTWKLHSIQTNPNAGWMYGTTVMDAAGNGSTIAYGPNNSPVTRNFSGSMSSTGILTSTGSDIMGFMSADKQTIFITQSGNGAYYLSIMQKVVTGTTYSTKDLMGIWQLHGLQIGISSASWTHCQYNINATGITAVSKMVRNNEALSGMTSSISISSDGTLTGFGTTSANGFLSADKSLGVNTLSDGSGGYYLAIYQKDLTANGDGGLQVQFADNNTGWVSVYNSIYGYFLLYKTTNGGSNWDVINGITNPVGGFYYFVDASNGWLFGASDTTIPGSNDILHTTNGGLSWTTQATNVGQPKSIHFSDLNHGWVVGKNALVMNTVDGGAHWTTLTNLGLASNANNKSVFTLNSNICYIGSGVPNTQGGRSVLKTTDGGGSWTPTQVPFGYDIFNVFFWDENNGWISGDYGQIAHYSNNTGILNTLSDEFPQSVYPNPATDFIKIKGFDETATFQIFDASGRSAGIQQINSANQINIQSLKAGIYFIKVQTLDNNHFLKFLKN